MSESSITVRPPKRTLFIIVAAAVIAVIAGVAIVRHRTAGAPQAATPEIAIRALAAKSLYYNGAARPWLLQWRPDLLTDEDRDEKSERTRAFVQAVENPKLFRQQDRKVRFDALLLVGDPSQYRPLLEHLLEAKDWTLTYLDHTSLVFRRDGSRVWEPGDLEPLAAKFSDKRDRAAFFSQAALRLLALRRGADAKVCLDRAESLDGNLPEVWNGHAVHRMNRGEWTPALANANRALAIDADFLPALATKTQVLYSTKKFSEAYELSRRLVEAHPNDPGLLFYHAKICHEAKATADEIRTLKRLIARAEAESQNASGYRIYLGQAYAKDGKAAPAIEEFTRALADADLPKEQRSFAEDTLAQVRERAGTNR